MPALLNEALQDEAYNGHTDIVKVLIEKGADVNHKDGWTALMRAAYNGHHEMCAMLIEKGADVNHQDEEGNTRVLYSFQEA